MKGYEFIDEYNAALDELCERIENADECISEYRKGQLTSYETAWHILEEVKPAYDKFIEIQHRNLVVE